jgi:hypothetical protein
MNDFAELPKGRPGNGILGSMRGHGDRQVQGAPVTVTTDPPMRLGMVGLGRMGANLVRRLMRDGHRCGGYARTEATVQAVAIDGAWNADTAS